MITFGCNDEGALGRDTSKEGSETEPGKVTLEGRVVQITAGDSHTAALLADGKVYAWGSFRVSIPLHRTFFFWGTVHILEICISACSRIQVGQWASHQKELKDNL